MILILRFLVGPLNDLVIMPYTYMCVKYMTICEIYDIISFVKYETNTCYKCARYVLNLLGHLNIE